MRALSRLTSGLRALLRRARAEQELDEELRQYIEAAAARKMSDGLDRDAAFVAASREAGSLDIVKDYVRDVGWEIVVENVWRDLRFAARTLARSPGFTAVAVLSLALAIGANTAVFTLIDALMLRPLPVGRPEGLVDLSAQSHGRPTLLSYPMYRDLADRQHVLSGILATAGETPYRLTIVEPGGHPIALDNMRVSFISGNYFSVLGVSPASGRLIQPDDDRRPDTSETLGSVVVLSYEFWQRQFGADLQAIGRTMLVGRSECRVIGVAPSGFFGEAVGGAPVAWVPLVPFTSAEELENRRGTITTYMARLAPGMSRPQAQAAMTLLFQQMLATERRVPDPIRDFTIGLADGSRGLDAGLRRKYAGALWMLMAIVALVLLIACANVAVLLLVRAASRRGEIGVRLAIGCSRRRLVSQLLAESALLSALGACAGVAVAYAVTRGLLRMIEGGPVPVRLGLAPDWRVLLFLGGVAVLTGLMFGLVPALRATRVNLRPSLQLVARGEGGGLSRQRLTRGLVTAQVALSLVLLVAAGLLLRSFANLHRLDWGFRADRVVIFDLMHNPSNREPDALAGAAWRAQQRVRLVPGVQSASVSGILLFSPSDISAQLAIPGYTPPDGDGVIARYNSVSARYFETVGMTIVDGRPIDERDVRNGAPVAVVNESFAHRYFSGGRALGRTLQLLGRRNGAAAPPAIEVIGVARDAKYNNLREEAKPMFFVPFAQIPRTLRSVEVRTTLPVAAVAAPVREALAEVSDDIMIRRIVTLSAQVDQSLAAERLAMELCSLFGAIALLLAAIGLYGVMAYTVLQRTGEFGVRMALGATGRGVVRLVVRDALALIVAGIVVGVPLALASTRVLSSLLYGLSATDPQTIALAVVVLLGAGMAAAYIPSRRAASVDPIVALRWE